MGNQPWTAGQEQRIKRWHYQGRSVAEIRLFLGAETRTLEAVRQKLSEMGLLRPKEYIPHEAGYHARECLRREIAIAKAEIRAGTAPPFKGSW